MATANIINATKMCLVEEHFKRTAKYPIVDGQNASDSNKHWTQTGGKIVKNMEFNSCFVLLQIHEWFLTLKSIRLTCFIWYNAMLSLRTKFHTKIVLWIRFVAWNDLKIEATQLLMVFSELSEAISN